MAESVARAGVRGEEWGPWLGPFKPFLRAAAATPFIIAFLGAAAHAADKTAASESGLTSFLLVYWPLLAVGGILASIGVAALAKWTIRGVRGWAEQDTEEDAHFASRIRTLFKKMVRLLISLRTDYEKINPVVWDQICREITGDHWMARAREDAVQLKAEEVSSLPITLTDDFDLITDMPAHNVPPLAYIQGQKAYMTGHGNATKDGWWCVRVGGRRIPWGSYLRKLRDDFGISDVTIVSCNPNKGGLVIPAGMRVSYSLTCLYFDEKGRISGFVEIHDNRSGLEDLVIPPSPATWRDRLLWLPRDLLDRAMVLVFGEKKETNGEPQTTPAIRHEESSVDRSSRFFTLTKVAAAFAIISFIGTITQAATGVAGKVAGAGLWSSLVSFLLVYGPALLVAGLVVAIVVLAVRQARRKKEARMSAVKTAKEQLKDKVKKVLAGIDFSKKRGLSRAEKERIQKVKVLINGRTYHLTGKTHKGKRQAVSDAEGQKKPLKPRYLTKQQVQNGVARFIAAEEASSAKSASGQETARKKKATKKKVAKKTDSRLGANLIRVLSFLTRAVVWPFKKSTKRWKIAVLGIAGMTVSAILLYFFPGHPVIPALSPWYSDAFFYTFMVSGGLLGLYFVIALLGLAFRKAKTLTVIGAILVMLGIGSHNAPHQQRPHGKPVQKDTIKQVDSSRAAEQEALAKPKAPELKVTTGLSPPARMAYPLKDVKARMQPHVEDILEIFGEYEHRGPTGLRDVLKAALTILHLNDTQGRYQMQKAHVAQWLIEDKKYRIEDITEADIDAGFTVYQDDVARWLVNNDYDDVQRRFGRFIYTLEQANNVALSRNYSMRAKERAVAAWTVRAAALQLGIEIDEFRLDRDDSYVIGLLEDIAGKTNVSFDKTSLYRRYQLRTYGDYTIEFTHNGRKVTRRAKYPGEKKVIDYVLEAVGGDKDNLPSQVYIYSARSFQDTLRGLVRSSLSRKFPGRSDFSLHYAPVETHLYRGQYYASRVNMDLFGLPRENSGDTIPNSSPTRTGQFPPMGGGVGLANTLNSLATG
ncbi:MAG: hypothetical protein JRI96_17115, partial [Deltaproteobacteria bacterium]|nr:hypothetical protein [Deltaproteobacteria bacterium]